jgi:hypothetical protein
MICKLHHGRRYRRRGRPDPQAPNPLEGPGKVLRLRGAFGTWPNITKRTQNGLGFWSVPAGRVNRRESALFLDQSNARKFFTTFASFPRAGVEPRDPPLNIAPLLNFGTRAARFRETGNPSRIDRPMHLGAGARIPLMRGKWQRITIKDFYNFRL